MKENLTGEQRKSFWTLRRARQMPERRTGEGGQKDSRPQDIHAKDVGEADVPQRRTLRGAELSSAPASREAKTGEVEKPRTTLEQRHPDWPRVTVMCYFSGHGKIEDMSGLQDHMPQADIYFYEYPHRDKITSYLQYAAEGENRTPEQVETVIDTFSMIMKIRGTALEPIYRALMDNKKRVVGNIDIGRKGDAVQAEDFKRQKMLMRTWSFDETVQDLERKLRQSALLHEKRESIMTRRFERELEEIFENNPELKEQPEVQVLVSMGSYHTGLAEKMKAKGITTESAFSQKQQIDTYQIQVQREIVNGEEISSDTLIKAYFEIIIAEQLAHAMQEGISSDEKMYHYIRTIASYFTSQEIEDIHYRDMRRRFSSRDLNKLVKKKGLGRLPKTNQELALALEAPIPEADLAQRL